MSPGGQEASAPLLAVLERARAHGFLGPGPVVRHVDHAGAFVVAVDGEAPASVLDLGAGGGVPGLVLAARWPGTRVVLLEAQEKRAAFLRWAVGELGWDGRVVVLVGRAERWGRDPAWRASMAVVCARSFGPPAVTAECGAPFLQVGGLLVVAEPPDRDAQRWPADGLARLGLVDEGVRRTGAGAVRRLRLASAVPDRYPRRDGIPAKRPVF